MPPLRIPRRTLTRRTFTAGTAAAAVAALVGCNSDDDPAPGNGALDQVTYLTGFATAPHDAFIWAGRELGYFSDAGIDISIELGEGPTNNQNVLANAAQFAKVDITSLLINTGQGNVEGIRLVALYEQQTLAGIVAPEDSGITTPQDLEGRSIGVLAGAPTQLLFPAYADLADFDADAVEVVPSDGGGLFGLLASGQVDALSTFVIQQGVVEAIIDRPTIAMPYSDYITDVFGTGLVCAADYAEANADLVVRFRDASLRAMEATLEDPEQAMEMMAGDDPAIQIPPGVGQINRMAPFVTAAGRDAIGVVEQDRVARGIAVLQANGLIPSGLTPEDIIDPNVTLLA